MEGTPSLSDVNDTLRIKINDAEMFYHTELDAGVSEKRAIAAGMKDLIEGLIAESEDYPLLLKIALAVEELQMRGLFGIDFSPRNIAITEDGTPVIFDVGVVSFDRPSAVKTVGCGKNAVPR